MVLRLADERGKAAEWSEAMFEALFHDGRDIGADEVIVDVSQSVASKRSESKKPCPGIGPTWNCATGTVEVDAVPAIFVEASLEAAAPSCPFGEHRLPHPAGRSAEGHVMSPPRAQLRTVMERAVQECIAHVEAGGLPFVGVVVHETGVISAFGVNQVQKTGDPTAHAEIVAMKNAMSSWGLTDLAGSTLLATGEPCGLCYRFAIDHRVDAIYVAVDRDEVATFGFDYRSSYSALGISDDLRAGLLHHIAVEQAAEPFVRYLQTRRHQER